MLDIIFSKKIKHYLELIRFNKPIGIFLLMWPCWFALALLPHNHFDLIEYYILFFIGSFLMRSAGCIINDLVDIDIDKKIARTAHRPLALNTIKKSEALIILLILLILSLIIILQFNFLTLIVSLLSIPIVILYPFMKRFTNFPQLILGLIFNWGVIIVAIEFINFKLINFVFLYIACIFWTMAYDTIYAYQDREDDIKNNIKSTAVLLGSKGFLFVNLCYGVFFGIIGYLGWKSSGSYLSLTVIILIIFAMYILLNRWQLKSKDSSNNYFKYNNYIGLVCFLFLLIF